MSVFPMVLEAARPRSRHGQIPLPGHLPAVSSCSGREEAALWGPGMRARSPFLRALLARPDHPAKALPPNAITQRVSISTKLARGRGGIHFTHILNFHWCVQQWAT